ncbi:hypothetical protein [Pseudaminobacter soli (ex Li et al. 2025)]|uniref:hypothetical protein n=1 Tax=Pseudaminobacter soli (ex Li et al. 2025) TaxID=1295366 RepID=UPI001AEC8ED3|nr:hypothetical protein [Mesorhizobium soli]
MTGKTAAHGAQESVMTRIVSGHTSGNAAREAPYGAGRRCRQGKDSQQGTDDSHILHRYTHVNELSFGKIRWRLPSGCVIWRHISPM